MYTKKINASPLCILCMLMPQIIPLLTLILVVHGMKTLTPRGSLLETQITCMGDYEIKPSIYETFKKKRKSICTKIGLRNGPMYLYQAFQFNVIYASTTYTKYKSWNKWAFIPYIIHFHFPVRKCHWPFFHPYDITHKNLTLKHMSFGWNKVN